MNKGAIGGIIVGACAGVLFILVGVFLWYRRRNRPLGLIHTEEPPDSASYGTGLITFHTPSLPTTVERYPPLPISTSSTTMLQPPSAFTSTSTSTFTPSPPHSSSSASNSDPRSRLILHNPNLPLTGPSHGGTLGPVNNITPVSENTGPYQNPGHVCTSENPAFRSLISPFFPFVDDTAATATRELEPPAFCKRIGGAVVTRN